eukprot:scaffold792_cov163-Amphora_coffeaeformis.AAC.2
MHAGNCQKGGGVGYHTPGNHIMPVMLRMREKPFRNLFSFLSERYHTLSRHDTMRNEVQVEESRTMRSLWIRESPYALSGQSVPCTLLHIALPILGMVLDCIGTKVVVAFVGPFEDSDGIIFGRDLAQEGVVSPKIPTYLIYFVNQ